MNTAPAVEQLPTHVGWERRRHHNGATLTREVPGVAATPSEDAWRVLGSRVLYDSPWITLSKTEVELPSGRHFEHHTVRMPAAAVAVITDAAVEHVLLTWRHRFVVDLWNYELPGGLIEEGDSAATTVEREILEETGYTVTGLREVASFEPMIGMVTSRHHVFRATALKQVGQPTERDEGRFEWIRVADVPSLLADGKVQNAGTLVGLLALLGEQRPTAEPGPRG